MTRTFLFFLLLALATPCQAQNIILLSAAVDNTAVKTNTPDVFAAEGEKINKTLLDNKICPVKSRIFYNKEANRKNLLEGLKWVKDTADQDSLVIVYLGAHGGVSTLGYACLMSDNFVFAAEIQRTLDRLPCKALLIVDTCHAGAFMDNWKNRNTFVIAACRRDEVAATCKVADPFAMAAIYADKNNDGIIDTEELYDYLIKNTDQHIVRSDYHFKSNIIKERTKVKTDIKLFCIMILWLASYVVRYRYVMR